MDVGGPAWDEARRAWRRLTKDYATLSKTTDGDAALHALSDISVVRRMLEQAELASVRIARRHRRSWAEIATNLGVTRQSAWERWRDLDEAPGDAEGATGADAAIDAAVAELATQPRAGQGADTVEVPDVISLSADAARRVLAGVGLAPLVHNPRGSKLAIPADAVGVVVDQVPKHGARRRPGSSVIVWIESDGGTAGVREPRRPDPPLRSATAARDADADA